MEKRKVKEGESERERERAQAKPVKYKRNSSRKSESKKRVWMYTEINSIRFCDSYLRISTLQYLGDSLLEGHVGVAPM